MIKPACIFIGASGTGKSTLADDTFRRHEMKLLPSRTSEIADKYGGFGELARNQKKRDAFQVDVFHSNCKRYLDAIGDGIPFVADRAFDCLAYTALEAFGVQELFVTEQFAWLMRFLKSEEPSFRPRVAVFFIRPDVTILHAARQSDAGRRNQYLTDECVYRIDGAIAMTLEYWGIPYIPIESRFLRDRIRLVDSVIKLATLREDQK